MNIFVYGGKSLGPGYLVIQHGNAFTIYKYQNLKIEDKIHRNVDFTVHGALAWDAVYDSLQMTENEHITNPCDRMDLRSYIPRRFSDLTAMMTGKGTFYFSTESRTTRSGVISGYVEYDLDGAGEIFNTSDEVLMYMKSKLRLFGLTDHEIDNICDLIGQSVI